MISSCGVLNSYSSGSSFHVGNNLRSDSLMECVSKMINAVQAIKPAINPSNVRVSIENTKIKNETLGHA